MSSFKTHLNVFHSNYYMLVRCRNEVPSSLLVVEKLILFFLQSDCPRYIVFFPRCFIEVQQSYGALIRLRDRNRTEEKLYLGSGKRSHRIAQQDQVLRDSFVEVRQTVRHTNDYVWKRPRLPLIVKQEMYVDGRRRGSRRLWKVQISETMCMKVEWERREKFSTTNH